MTPKKLAIFVEGQTERIFIESLLTEIAGKSKIAFEKKVASGNSLVTLKQIDPPPQTVDGPLFVLLVDCQNDEKVKSVVLDQRNSLIRANYSLILGLRDLYPQTLADLPVVKSRLSYGVPTAGVPTHILLAVAELEAWFLQESTHYPRIDERLDPSQFAASFGFDPIHDSAESVLAPASKLHEIYSSVGKAYRKDRKRVQRTVDALDYAQVYFESSKMLPHLKEFLNHIDNFIEIR